jgi:hypothetical protein
MSGHHPSVILEPDKPSERNEEWVMARLKYQVLNLFLILMIYFWALTGLVMVTELKTSAAEYITSEVVSEGEASRPIAPRRDITSQRLAPLDVDSGVPPFWSR